LDITIDRPNELDKAMHNLLQYELIRDELPKDMFSRGGNIITITKILRLSVQATSAVVRGLLNTMNF